MIYDYIVVGAGPAGCVCAGELKKRNYSVCVLEKQRPDYRKVCGDGISHVCLQTLRSIGFPVEAFEDAGAVRIRKYIHYINGRLYTDRIGEHHKEAYGLARNRTDSVFRKVLLDDAGIPVFYGMDAGEIKNTGQGYEVCGLRTEKIILAAGASARIRIDGREVLRPDPDSPAGISAVIRAKRSGEPFFMFDYREEYGGTYGWIFSTGDGEYNAGLWLRSDKASLRAGLAQFLELRGREYLGDGWEWISRPRGAVMGIGKRRICPDDSVIFIGDAANTSNPKDGEGISAAVKDALDFVSRLQ